MYDIYDTGNFTIVLSVHACGVPSELRRVTVNQLFERTPEGLELILSASDVANDRRALRRHLHLSRQGWFDLARKFSRAQEIVTFAQDRTALIEGYPQTYGLNPGDARCSNLRAVLYGSDCHLIDEIFALHESFSKNQGFAGMPGPWEEYNPPSFYETLIALEERMKALQKKVEAEAAALTAR